MMEMGTDKLEDPILIFDSGFLFHILSEGMSTMGVIMKLIEDS